MERPDRSLWKKYLEGKATKEELKALENWLQSASTAMDDEEFIEWLQQDAQTGDPMPHDMTERLRQQLRQHAAPQEGRVIPLRRAAVRRMLSPRRWVAAASVVILVLGGFIFYGRLRHSQPHLPDISLTWDSIANTGALAKLVTLPDQTKVWLNKDAILYVSKTYGAGRQVRLLGEGYFEVSRDQHHPFTVTTGEVQTLVLGTAFNIDNTPGRSAVYISLLKGSVKVRHGGNDDSVNTTSVTLSPGEMAVAGRQAGNIPVSKIGVGDAAGWINGDLVLNQLPLSEALVKLGAYYGIVIRADAGLVENKTVTAVYHRKESWQQALQHLLFIYQLSYTTDHYRNIYITKPAIR